MKDKKIMVGHPITRLSILSTIPLVLLYSLFITFAFNALFVYITRAFNFFHIPWPLLYILITCIYILILIPHTADMEYMCIENDVLKYMRPIHYLDKWHYLNSILKNNTIQPHIVIPVSKISVFRISYGIGLGTFTFLTHSPYFSILLKDGTMCHIKCNYVLEGFEGYQKMIDYLEERGVEILDPYQLREALSDKETFVSKIKALEQKAVK